MADSKCILPVIETRVEMTGVGLLQFREGIRNWSWTVTVTVASESGPDSYQLGPTNVLFCEASILFYYYFYLF